VSASIVHDTPARRGLRALVIGTSGSIGSRLIIRLMALRDDVHAAGRRSRLGTKSPVSSVTDHPLDIAERGGTRAFADPARLEGSAGEPAERHRRMYAEHLGLGSLWPGTTAVIVIGGSGGLPIHETRQDERRTARGEGISALGTPSEEPH
jgi:hypothetical protein